MFFIKGRLLHNRNNLLSTTKTPFFYLPYKHTATSKLVKILVAPQALFGLNCRQQQKSDHLNFRYKSGTRFKFGHLRLYPYFDPLKKGDFCILKSFKKFEKLRKYENPTSLKKLDFHGILFSHFSQLTPDLTPPLFFGCPFRP